MGGSEDRGERGEGRGWMNESEGREWMDGSERRECMDGSEDMGWMGWSGLEVVTRAGVGWVGKRIGGDQWMNVISG